MIAALVIFSLATLLLRLNIYRVLLAIDATAKSASGGTKSTTTAFSDIVIPYLTLVAPGLSVLYPWVVATSIFVETNVIAFAISFATLLLGGKYCERVWSSRELAVYLGLTGVIPVVLTFFSLILLFAIRVSSGGDGANAGTVHVVNGTVGLQLAFLVAFKQLVPEHSIVLFRGLFTIKVKHLVMPVLVLYTLLGALRGVEITLLAWYGFFTAWVYLRFYRVTYVDPLLPTTTAGEAGDAASNLSGGSSKTRIRGDASEVFALNTFFYPRAVREVVHALSRLVFKTLVAFRVCTPFGQEEVEQGNIRASLRTNGPRAAVAVAAGSKSAAEVDAERRRAYALKVLEERLDTRKNDSAA
jgi:hypothetical protein